MAILVFVQSKGFIKKLVEEKDFKFTLVIEEAQNFESVRYTREAMFACGYGDRAYHLVRKIDLVGVNVDKRNKNF